MIFMVLCFTNSLPKFEMVFHLYLFKVRKAAGSVKGEQKEVWGLANKFVMFLFEFYEH